MPEDKKKFKPQNLSGLIYDTAGTSLQQETRDSSSPAPTARQSGTLTSASGTYKLSAVKDNKGESSIWNSDKKDTSPAAGQSPAPQTTKEPSPDASKGNFNWVDADEWNPDTINTSTSKPAASSGTAPNPWAAPKVVASKLDLETQIKKLQTQPNTNNSSGSSSSTKQDDNLSRFRIDSDDPNLTPRDLFGASRMHSDMRRDEARSYGRFERSYRDDDDDMDWHSGRQSNSMRRGPPSGPSFGREPPAKPSVSTGLRPLRSSITKVVPTGDEKEDLKPASATAETTELKPEEELSSQKEAMQQARLKALEARIAKERKEEEERKERLAARLALLDAKEKAKREEEAAERRKQEAIHRQETSRREAKEREEARQEAERRHKEEIKEKAMEESWSARKQSGGGGQPLQSMRRKEKPNRDSPSNFSSSGDKREKVNHQKGNQLGNQHGNHHGNHQKATNNQITIKLPELGHMDPIENPESVVEKFPHTSSWHGQEPDRNTTNIRIVLPDL